MIIIWIFAAVALVFGLVVFRGAPYVPSKRRELERVFAKLYSLGENDTLVDIGSGDGVVLRAAARRGVRAIGYELNPILVLIARLLSRRDKRVEVYWADLWRRPIPTDTTVVYVFGESRDIRRMVARVQAAATTYGHDIMLISYGFRSPDHDPVGQLGAHYLYRLEA